MGKGFQKIKRYMSVILVLVLVLTMLPTRDVWAEEAQQVTFEMCDILSNNIEALATSFAYDADTKAKLEEYRATYNQYVYWDQMYETTTTLDSVRNENVLTQMEQAYLMITYLDGCYDQIAPFEGLTDYFDVTTEEFMAFQTVSKDPESDLTKFVGHFTGASDEVLTFFGKEGTAVSDETDNNELGKTVEAVYLFVENNATVFEGVSLVNDVRTVAPELTDIVKATYEDINPKVEVLGTWKEEFEANGSDSQKNALDRRIAKVTSNEYTTLVEFYDAYLTRCQKIGFEKQIDDLYEDIYSTMDYTTLSSDDVKISEVENEYVMLPQNVQDQIVNLNMLQALRDKYNENMEYYKKVVVPAIEASALIEEDFWKLYDMNWPNCADAEKNDAETVEKNLVAADAIIVHAQKTYDALTSAQKNHVTTLSYLDYMEKTYQSMNLRYMTTTATIFYPMLASELLLDYAKDVDHAYRWMDMYVSEADMETLQKTLVDPECESSDVVSVISAAAQRTAYLEQNIGRETEAAIRKLVTMEGNQKGFISLQEIERVYALYQKALSYEAAEEELTDVSKYQIEALHGLVLMAEKTSDALVVMGEIDLSIKDNADLFVEKYNEMLSLDAAFLTEFAQLQKDFAALENGSICMTDTTGKALRTYEQELGVQADRKEILDVYDSIGTMTVMDKVEIARIHEAWMTYLSIIGEETETDSMFAGSELRRFETMATHIETFIHMCETMSEAPQTQEEKEAVLQAERYYEETLTKEERALVPKLYVTKLQQARSLDDMIQSVIRSIDAIVAPVDDATYVEFVSAFDAAKTSYDLYLSTYPQGEDWIVNAERLTQYEKAKNLIERIKELLQLHSSQMCENKVNIENAIADYEDLPTETQDMIYNYPLIYSLYNDVVQADAVRETLNGLLVLTLADEPAVTNARIAFDSLGERGKQFVNNSILLNLAEKQIAALKQNAAQALKEQQSQTNATPKPTVSPNVNDNENVEKPVSTIKESIKKAKVSKVSKKYNLKTQKKLKSKIKKLKKRMVVKLNGKKLRKDKDYTIKVKKNKKKTKVTFTIQGKGNYKHKKKVTFKIVYSKKV